MNQNSAKPLASEGSDNAHVDVFVRAYHRRLELPKRRWSVVALLAALTLTILEGAIRKWVLGTDSSPLIYLTYFSKDIVFLVLLFLPAEKKADSASLVFRRWLIPGCFLLVSGAIGSSTAGFNSVGAVLTLRASVLLPVIAYLAIRKLDNIPLRTFAMILTLLTIANFILGAYQNSLPVESTLNRYAALSMQITAVESGVRATGTFAYIAGLGVIALGGMWAGMTLLSLGGKQRDRIAGWLALLSGFGCSLAAVSRAPIILGAMMVLVWGGAFRVGLSSALRILLAGALIFIIAILLGIAPTVSNLGYGLLQREEVAGDSFQERAFGQFQEAYEAVAIAPFGNGLGSEQVAGIYYTTGVMGFATFENQLPRLIMETGIFGLMGFLLICVGAIAALKAAKQDVSKSARSVLLATQLLLASLFYTNVIFNHTASSFAWLIFVAVLAGVKAPSAAAALGTITKTSPHPRSGREWAESV